LVINSISPSTVSSSLQAFVGDRANHIAFGKDTRKPAIFAQHDHRADAAARKQPCRFRQGGVGIDGDDLAPLREKDMSDLHRAPPSAFDSRMHESCARGPILTSY
jgi:hypothetical protein